MNDPNKRAIIKVGIRVFFLGGGDITIYRHRGIMLLCDERKMGSLEMKNAEFMLVGEFRIIGDLGEFMALWWMGQRWLFEKLILSTF